MTLLALLLLSTMSVLAFLPATVHATTAGAGTITLSANSGNSFAQSAELYHGSAAATIVSYVTVTGSGFPSGQDSIDLCIMPATDTISASCGETGATNLDGWTIAPSILGTTGGTDQANALGAFTDTFKVPTTGAGSYDIFAFYTTTAGTPEYTTPVSFTVNPAISVFDAAGGSADPAGTPIAILLSGWGSAGSAAGADTVTLIPGSFFNGLVGTVATAATGSAEKLIGAGVTVGPSPGGSINILGFGTSGDTSKSTFTVVSSILIQNPACAVDVYSMQTSVGSSICISGEGFAKSSTIANAGAVTIEGVKTISNALKTDATGAFPATVVTAENTLPVGLLNITIGGTVFSFNAGNIQGDGVLIGSNPCPGASCTPLATPVDASTLTASGHVGDTVFIFGFGYNIAANEVGAFTLAADTCGDAAFVASALGTSDANGAIMPNFVIPARCYSSSGYSLAQTATADGKSPASTVTVTPELSLALDNLGSYPLGTHSTTVDSFGQVAAGAGLTFARASGFAGTDHLTLTLSNGEVWGTITTSATGTYDAALPGIGTPGVPDLPEGSYTVNGSSSTAGDWAVSTNSLFVLPVACGTINNVPVGSGDFGVDACMNVPNAPSSSSLSVTAGPGGTHVALLTSNNGGIHGLLPSTATTVMWDGSTQVASFTTTATGGVPVGVSFVVPASTSGVHYVDIFQGGASAFYFNIVDWNYFSQYANLLFNVQTSLISTPTLASAGTMVTLSGNGLPPNTALFAELNGIAYASFTSSSTGAVPSGVTATVPDMAATHVALNDPSGNPYCLAGGNEKGVSCQFLIYNTAGILVGTAAFVYNAAVALSSYAGPSGTTDTMTATGLAPLGSYFIVFDCVQNTLLPGACNGVPTGSAPTNVIVGALIANALGDAMGTFTIPSSAPAGSYTIEITGNPGLVGNGLIALNSAPVFTVGGVVTGQQFTISGSASQVTLSGTPFLSVTYSNPSSAQATGIVILSVQNALGQTVFITTSTITPAASSSATAFLDLGPLASGSYTATIFVLSTNGGSLSAPTTGVPIKV